MNVRMKEKVFANHRDLKIIRIVAQKAHLSSVMVNVQVNTIQKNVDGTVWIAFSLILS